MHQTNCASTPPSARESNRIGIHDPDRLGKITSSSLDLMVQFIFRNNSIFLENSNFCWNPQLCEATCKE